MKCITPREAHNDAQKNERYKRIQWHPPTCGCQMWSGLWVNNLRRSQWCCVQWVHVGQNGLIFRPQWGGTEVKCYSSSEEDNELNIVFLKKNGFFQEQKRMGACTRPNVQELFSDKAHWTSFIEILNALLEAEMWSESELFELQILSKND
jgi:hypothetical protein